jgi:hypothetical protein
MRTIIHEKCCQGDAGHTEMRRMRLSHDGRWGDRRAALMHRCRASFPLSSEKGTEEEPGASTVHMGASEHGERHEVFKSVEWSRRESARSVGGSGRRSDTVTCATTAFLGNGAQLDGWLLDDVSHSAGAGAVLPADLSGRQDDTFAYHVY